MEINAQQLKEAGDYLKKKFPEKGFALVVFDFGDTLREFRYISNAQRVDMIETFDALLAKWRGQNDQHN